MSGVREMQEAIRRWIAQHRTEMLDDLMAPVSIAVGRNTPGFNPYIHKANERLPLADFDRLVELLVLSIVKFCS